MFPYSVTTVKGMKPAVGSRINWSHPYTQGLRFFDPLIGYGTRANGASGDGATMDLVSGQQGNASSTAVFRSVNLDAGQGIESVAATNGYRWPKTLAVSATPGMSLSWLLTAPILIGVKFRMSATVASGALVFGWTAGAVEGFAIQMLAGSSNVTARFNSTTNSSSFLALNTWYTAFGFWGGQDVKLYVFDANGQLVEAPIAPGFSGPVTFASRGVGMIASTGGDYTNRFQGSLEWGAIWKNAFPVAVLSRIAANPYQMLIPAGVTWASPGAFVQPTAVSPQQWVPQRDLAATGGMIGRHVR